jgi:hypothetical protein
MLLYGAIMFLSAFLLFLIQPLIGKYILPWFGGTPSVWTTCMLFFQALLLGGYGYAHALAGRWPPRRQALFHISLLSASILVVLWLSILPSQAWKPVGGQFPVLRILGLLSASIGAPYLLLASTSPLLQSWFSRARPGSSPYRLYALSNLGSLLAILGYPFLIEPALSLSRQAAIWTWTYIAFAVVCVLLSLKMMKAGMPTAAADNAAGPEVAPGAERPGPGRHILWLSLTACSSVMLLATTSTMCQDLAVVPLLWILPLALYLLSFILCFQHERLYRRPLFLGGLAASIVWTCFVLFGGVPVALRWQILSYSLTLFMCCMVCHGELVRLKPGTSYLTSFYLMIAAGGSLGGLLVTVAAPYLLKGFWEYHLGLLATVLLTLIVLYRDRMGPGFPRHWLVVWATWGVLCIAWAGLAYVLVTHIRQSLDNSIETSRNFFGVLRVLDLNRDDPEEHSLSLMHGRIEHGFQFQDTNKRYWPVSYYGPDSGIGLAMYYHPRRLEQQPMRIGVIGLGTGTMAVYGRQGDYIRFYEINPGVLQLSDKYFTYRKDSPAKIEVALGDARVLMEIERQRGESQQFDVLVVDAFSSDAIPVHLLTRECFQTYRYHLKEDGILAVHITNRYFDLSPIVRNLIVPDPKQEMQALWFHDLGNGSLRTDRTDWVLLTANQQFLANPGVERHVTPWNDPVPPPKFWTDDYSNLFSLLHERRDNP